MVDSSLVKRGVVLLCSFVMLVVFFTLPFVSRSRQEEEERQDQEESFRPAAGIVWKDDSAAPKRRTKPETSRGYRVSRCWSCPTQEPGQGPVAPNTTTVASLTPKTGANCVKKVFRKRVLPRYVTVSPQELKDIEDAIHIDVFPSSGLPHLEGANVLMSLWKKCSHITGEANCGDMTYQSVTWIVFDWTGKVLMAVDPPYPSQASKDKNPVFRRGKGLKFINATHVVGLLGSAVQPPYRDYRLFVWNMDQPEEVSLYKVHSHHDVEYNPQTHHFLTFTTQPTSYGYSMEWIDEGRLCTGGMPVPSWSMWRCTRQSCGSSSIAATLTSVGTVSMATHWLGTGRMGTSTSTPGIWTLSTNWNGLVGGWFGEWAAQATSLYMTCMGGNLIPWCIMLIN
jgi:hypothetical protein